MRAIYFRVTDDAAAWVEAEHERTGLGRATIVNAVVEEAARLGWKIARKPGAVVEEEKK